MNRSPQALTITIQMPAKNICLEQKLPYWNYKWQKKIYKKKYKI